MLTILFTVMQITNFVDKNEYPGDYPELLAEKTSLQFAKLNY
jgi:hypothetical protein